MQLEERNWTSYWENTNIDSAVEQSNAKFYTDAFLKNIPLQTDFKVMDFGCGSGYVAHALAPAVKEICLWDKSAKFRALAKLRGKDIANLSVLDNFPPDKSFNLIVVHSVIQYMSAEEFKSLLATWHRALAPGGQLVISDIMPKNHNGFKDLYAMATTTPKQFCAFLLKSVPQYFKYWQSNTLLQVDQQQIQDWGKAAGYKFKILPNNLSYYYSRFTAVGEKL